MSPPAMCCCPLPEDQFGLKRIFGYVLGMGELHGDWSLRSDHGDRNGQARAGAGALVTAATDHPCRGWFAEITIGHNGAQRRLKIKRMS